MKNDNFEYDSSSIVRCNIHNNECLDLSGQYLQCSSIPPDKLDSDLMNHLFLTIMNRRSKLE